ncbi:hypothetical protein [Methylobacterium iners]|uniref:HTH cro/C1-type domain-containing protein n=1 Tax=Methylobacterium iners TaxID=418707 RepID=A0ABQ4RQ55_9HYPH|nr:hypothetical protein [Methylobacterium iners]GJD92891.1 hypothetical protein OCOJLMKI_0074 [Methylobacterium iners]
MGKSHLVVAQLGDAERTTVQERTTAFLRQVYPTKTAENVAADTGISANTIAKWLDRGSAPTSWAFLRLLTAYGPELACAVMTDPPAWLDRAAREEQARRLRCEIADLQARLDGAGP